MKVAIHSYNYTGNDAGIALVTRNTTKRLAHKHDIHIITQHRNVLTQKLLPREEVMHNCTVHRIPRSKIPVIGTLIYFARVLLLLRTLKPDILHEQELCGIGYLAKKFLAIPYLTFAHGIDVFGAQPLLARFLKKRSLEQATVRVSNTEQMAEYIKKNWINKPIEIIHNGIDVASFDLPKKKHTGIHLIATGRLIPAKGYQTTLKALPAILAKHNNVHFSIIGDGKYEPELRTLTQELHLEDHVTFVGRIPHQEVMQKIINSDICVFPTYHTETCSLVLLEALAAGIPIVTTDWQANAEILIEGKGGTSCSH